jgi:ComF family protein
MLAAPLAALMREAGRVVLEDADAVVPVPLHPLRALDRGFNQADDLAIQLGLPVWRALRRTRHGPPQAALTSERRRSNVAKAFAVRRSALGWLTPEWKRRLAGRTLVLVDDVMTTGATLDACGEVLLAAGAKNVRVLTTARAVATPHAPPIARLRHAAGRRR